ncbi:hypothetical protein [Nocardioides dokdonensis]|nr:hypothetical protein [Nocardioides dokdonensis]
MRVPAPALRRKADREISTAVAEYDETLCPVPPGGEPEQTGDTDADLRALRAYEEQRRERGDFSDRWESWEEYADEWDLPLRPRVPRRSVFFSTADEVLGKRSTYRGQQVYTIPDTRGGTMPNTITREEISEALEVREIVAALREHKRRHSSRRDSGGRFAPAADGTVVPLDSRRR